MVASGPAQRLCVLRPAERSGLLVHHILPPSRLPPQLISGHLPAWVYTHLKSLGHGQVFQMK